MRLLGIGGDLFFQHGVIPAQGDGVLVIYVSVLEGVVSVLGQILNHLGEVCLNEVYHGVLLGIEALQGP